MEREDIKLIPLAAVGLAMGAYEVFIKPFIKEKVVKKVAKAAISYYKTEES